MSTHPWAGFSEKVASGRRLNWRAGKVWAAVNPEPPGTTFSESVLLAPQIMAQADREPSLSELCVLIVDDNVELAENLADIATGWGVRVLTAASAEEGLGVVVGAAGIDVLLTDFRLPGLTGAQLIAELRRRGCLVPAIVMSAYTDGDMVDAALLAGAAGVLSKPLAVAELRSTLIGFADLLAADVHGQG